MFFYFWEKSMKFQLKALAAAMVLAAAVPAQAALDLGTTGNGSMTIAVFDRVANVSALFDLGKNYSDFSVIGTSFADSNVDAEGVNFSWDLTSGDYATAWSTFAGLTNSANWQFAVLGGDNAGSGAGNRGLISTLNQPAVTAITTNPLQAQISVWDNYMGANTVDNGTIYQNHGTELFPTGVANGGSVGNVGLASALIYFGGNKPNAAGSVVVGNVGQSLAVYQNVTGSSAFGATTSTIFGNNAAFTFTANGALTYTTNDPVVVVPEADTWAMMLLGLGFMGFAARRKQA
jgi:PEP-CTERM motif